MTANQAAAFLQALGCHPSYTGGEWVRCPCPLAPYRHKNGTDHNPSFGISITTDRPSRFHCFTCDSGSAEELVNALEYYQQQNPATAIPRNFVLARQFLTQESVDVFPLSEFTEFTVNISKPFQEWPLWFLEEFPAWRYAQAAQDYLLGVRHLTEIECDHYQLRFDPIKQMVLFPFFTVHGKFAGIRGRAIWPHGPQHHDYSWNSVNNTGAVWYNESVLNQDQPIVIVEGQFDCLAVARVYPHVLANLTAKPAPQKMKKLQQASGVVLLLDNDETGKAATLKYCDYFQKWQLPHAIAKLPEGIKDPDDAGETILKELLSELI